MPNVRFELFRISLFEREQRSLFSDRNERWLDFLRRVFMAPMSFQSGSIMYSYVLSRDLENGCLVGRVGREYHQGENLPPEDGFGEVEHFGHKASVVAINIKDGVDGQKIAFQVDPRVGRPAKIMDAFSAAVDEKFAESNFFMRIHPIVDESTFWGFVEENDRKIISLRLDYVVPNGIWTLDKSIRDELKAAGEQLRANQLTTIASNPDGIDITSLQVHDAIDYAASGSGDISAKAKNGRRYNSKDKIRKTILSIAEDRKRLIDKVADDFLRVIGNE